MKKIGVLACLMIMVVSMLAPAAFADENAASADSGSAPSTGFEILSSTPHDGDTGVAVENLSVKIYCSKEVMPETKADRKANAKQFKLTDAKGNKIPIKVYYSQKEKEEDLMMVVSDIVDSDIVIEGDTKYTLTIGKDFKATDGTRLGADQTITFRTLDQSKSTAVYMVMMVVMMVGMIYFTSKSAKKAAEKEKQASGKSDTVNPYKEAKRTGKSVQEIVEKDKQRKAKEAAALAKRREAEAALEEEISDEKNTNKRVAAPRPIAAAGSQYKVTVKKTETPEKKNATNPKNQTGKQKNSKNKGKKKK